MPVKSKIGIIETDAKSYRYEDGRYVDTVGVYEDDNGVPVFGADEIYLNEAGQAQSAVPVVYGGETYTDINGNLRQAIAVATYGPPWILETQAALDAFDVQPPEDVIVALDRFMRRIVRDGVYANLDLLHVGAIHDAQAARVNLINPGVFDLVENNSPVFTPYRGYAGNGTDSDLRIDGYRPLSMGTTKYKLDSATLGAVSLTNYAGYRVLVGHTNWGCYISPRNNAGNALARMNHASQEGPDLTYATADSAGMLVCVRDTASHQAMYKNGVMVAQNTTPSRPSLNTMSADMRVGSGGAAAYGTDQIALVFAGEALTSGDVAAINGAFSEYMNAVGTGYNFGVVINGNAYVLHADEAASDHAFSTIGGDQRFEVRSGDTYKGDEGIPPPRERSELVGQTKLPNDGTPIWISFGQFVEAGAANTSDQNIIGQLHATEDAGDPASYPIVFLNMNGEDIELRTAAFDTPSPHPYPPQPVTRWSQADYERGVWRNWVFRVVVNPAGGELTAWLDGDQVYNGTPPIGYRDAIGPYFMFGVYRLAASNTIAIRYRNVEVGTDNLSDRVNNPL